MLYKWTDKWVAEGWGGEEFLVSGAPGVQAGLCAYKSDKYSSAIFVAVDSAHGLWLFRADGVRCYRSSGELEGVKGCKVGAQAGDLSWEGDYKG